MADVRVRLVFVDDVARHVQRRRGFSSCWYLVPSDVKLVGDLAHVLLREFELRKRCPKGLELRLEELPLLATQSIRVVRDNDTIVIQCPPLEDDKGKRESSSSESEEEVIKTRKRKLHKKEKQEQPKKKNKNVKHVEKEVKDRPSASTKDREVVAVKTIAGAKKNSKVESSSSSSSSESDSSSGSSSESSSSNESEDEAAAQSNGKRVTQDATTKQQLGKSKGKASADANGENKRKGKGKYEERWKRPYEILATVLDKKPQNSSKNTTSPPDLSKALASYPAVPVASSSFEPKDVIAFKTLTLCLETWQPVLSEWKCGQVQSVDASGNTIEVASWVLEVNGESVDFCESPSDELYSVQTSEISELRFLSGPSYASLQQSAPRKTA
ncbi:Coilin, N-terminal domain [Phytophthora cactorum]|nr:Coilin, N-terminal domain [Phytophthora cactorum]